MFKNNILFSILLILFETSFCSTQTLSPTTTTIVNLTFSFNNLEIIDVYCKTYWIRCLSISVLLGVLVLCTIIGNAFVIAAVVLDRNLHNVANHLIVSLAVADLMVATMVSH
jgi:5-hydroxytryptamine receptor 1